MGAGDMEGALDLWEEAAATIDKLANNFPRVPQVCLKQGDVRVEAGNVLMKYEAWGPAAEQFLASIPFRRKLCTLDDKIRWTYLAGEASLYAGVNASKAKKMSAAEAAFRDSIRWREQLTEREPDNVEYAYGLVIGREALGNLLADMPDRRADAISELRESLRLARLLVAKEDRSLYQGELGACLHNLAGQLVAEQPETSIEFLHEK